MQLMNRKSFCSKAIVTLLLMAVSTMLYAARPPSSPGLSCTISPLEEIVVVGETISYSVSIEGGSSKGKDRLNWTFDGGSPSSSTSSSEDVTYDSAGTFDVLLTVADKSGSAECSTTVLVNPADGGGNNSPIAVNDNVSTNQDTSVDINVIDNDSDSDGSIDAATVTLVSNVTNGTTTNNGHGVVTYFPNPLFTGSDSFTYTVKDDQGASSNHATVSITVNATGGGDAVSINSTSQNGTPATAVTEQPFVSNNNYKIFATNDLGMHCGDFDTRISSILPPFNVLHAQVIRRGGEPDILTPADKIEVVYSAASNSTDPILGGLNAAGEPVLLSVLRDGSGGIYKTNFWDIARDAYDPFYPPGILPAFYPLTENILDLGLPMPNVERLWLGDGVLTAEQQSMPGRFGPYVDNNPQAFTLFTVDQPFFIDPGFKFGYVSEGVNWFEAAGIALTAFDDFGRENPWPLYRVQAKDRSGDVLASTDIVVPISGEANCGACHLSEFDGGNEAATAALGENVATVDDDPDKTLPFEISKEYAADLNIVRLHDQKHETDLEANTPIVCQSCHYTPALDLAQVGPRGPQNDDPVDSGNPSNGRDQVVNKSMSNVMHGHHATVTDTSGNRLFPTMPPPVDSEGNLRDPSDARTVLMDTCYQCHPGRRTDCLRGAMANGGMLCQDCHGDMEQVGNDFSRTVGPGSIGTFELASDFYDHTSGTPRVPWANEPGCGSCHTGDAVTNIANDEDVIPAMDGIRLMQAYRISDDASHGGKATPIVPTNKRFAENVVTEGPATGNPMLYRVSTGHEGVFCEACHGATHGIWPNKNPNANDNVTAMQLQGHTGTITECDTCHTGSFNIEDFKSRVGEGMEMDGPHGMHPVNSPMWNEKHKEVFELNNDTCRTCHGTDGKGTVLSTTATTRTLECKNTEGNFQACRNGEKFVTVEQNTVIGCDNCHSMEN